MVPYGRRLYEAHGEVWHGIEESQNYMDRKLAIANERRHGTTLRRPREVFVQEEAKALKPLPALAYEIEQFHEGTVRQDGSVRFANKYYSVDEQYKGKTVIVLGNSKQVCIYHKGKLLEVHARITDPNQAKSIKPQHMQPWKRAMQDGSMYRKRAQKLGPHVEEMVLRLLKQGQGVIDTRKSWGILSLDKSYPKDRIDAACRRALELDRLGFRVVKALLEMEQAEASQRQAETEQNRSCPERPSKGGTHKYVRPLSVYQKQLSLFKN